MDKYNNNTYGQGYRREDSPEAIRADIERTRAEMGAKIDRIGERFSPEQLREQAQESMNEMMTDTANRINRYVRDHRRELADSLVDTVKHNPMPTALVGLGLGWLLVESFSTSSNDTDYPYGDRYARRRRAQYAGSGYDYATGAYGSNYDPRYGTGYNRGAVRAVDANGYPYEENYYGGYPYSEGYGERYTGEYDERYAQRTYADTYANTYADTQDAWYEREALHRDDDQSGNGRHLGEAVRERGHDMRERAEGAAHAAGHQAHEVGENIRHGAEEVQDRTRDALGATGEQMRDLGYEARHQAAEAGRTLRHQTAEAGRTMRHEAAQAGRAMNHQARRAGHYVGHEARAAGRQVGRSLEENPTTFGLLAFGAGLALSLLLPETRMEDRAMGRVSDQVKESGYEMAQDAAQRAQHVVDEVRPELEQTARKVRDDLRDTAREAQHDVEDALDKAKHEAQAEAEGAKGKAKEEAGKVKNTAKQETSPNS